MKILLFVDPILTQLCGLCEILGSHINSITFDWKRKFVDQ